MEKKKILFIDGPLNGGGAEKVLIDLLRNFDYTKFQVDLCLYVPGGKLIGDVPKEVHVFSIWNSYTLSYKLAYRFSHYLGLDTLLTNKITSKIQDKYDVIISFLEGTPLKLHAMLNYRGIQISWVHADLYRDPYEAGQFRKGEELNAYNQMDKVVCVASNTADAFKLRFPQCTTPVQVIYNPIDYKYIIKQSIKLEIENKVFTIITVGRLTSQKKMDRVIRMAKRFKDEGIKNIHFQIIGEGELKSELQNQIQTFEVQDQVTLLGFKKNPYPYIKAADLMFVCSAFEGFSLVLCEAMLLEVPVVSTKTAGPIEILEDSKFGLLCEQDDDSMFRALLMMYSDSSLRENYRKQGRLRVEKYFIDNTMRSLYKLLDE